MNARIHPNPRYAGRVIIVSRDAIGQGITVFPTISLAELAIKRWRDKYPQVNSAIRFLDATGWGVQFSANVTWLPMDRMNGRYCY